MIEWQCNGEEFKVILKFETLNVMTKSYKKSSVHNLIHVHVFLLRIQVFR